MLKIKLFFPDVSVWEVSFQIKIFTVFLCDKSLPSVRHFHFDYEIGVLVGKNYFFI